MRKRRSTRAAAHQSLQSSCLEWLQREIRTSHLPRPRWLTRSPIRESPSCPPRSTLTSTSTSPASEPYPLGRATAATLTSPPTGLSQPNTQVMKTFPPPASNLNTFIRVNIAWLCNQSTQCQYGHSVEVSLQQCC